MPGITDVQGVGDRRGSELCRFRSTGLSSLIGILGRKKKAQGRIRAVQHMNTNILQNEGMDEQGAQQGGCTCTQGYVYVSRIYTCM